MNVWLVIPAWRRVAVTRLCLAQKQQLVARLAVRGITCHVAVIADDENLDVAAEFAFDTVEQRNVLGLKVNDGMQYACDRGADYVAFVGSDDWIHEDWFDMLLEPRAPGREPLISGHLISVVDMVTGRLRRLGVRGPSGVPPWLMPRHALAPSGFRPSRDDRVSGMEGRIQLGLGPVEWLFHDPHDLTRVDFKTAENMTPYDRISRLLGYGEEITDPWTHLAARYGIRLADLARETHESLLVEVAA